MQAGEEPRDIGGEQDPENLAQEVAPVGEPAEHHEGDRQREQECELRGEEPDHLGNLVDEGAPAKNLRPRPAFLLRPRGVLGEQQQLAPAGGRPGGRAPGEVIPVEGKLFLRGPLQRLLENQHEGVVVDGDVLVGEAKV